MGVAVSLSSSTLRLWNAYDKKKPQLQVIKARDRQGENVTPTLGEL